jgi:serine/threonine-protein kinase
MNSTFLTCPNGHPVETADTLCPQCGTLPLAEPVPLASSFPVLPGYEVLGVLGRGGMGVVYKARQTGLDRLVALKMIRDGALASAEERTRFHVEARAIARLQHPHVVQVFEVSEHQGQPYFSLELVPGGSLAERLRGTPQPPREAAALVETLAHAVQAAHQEGIIHRDLKPANVLLTPDGAPKVGDFGLAKKLGDSSWTETGAIMGTPSYMAPEQAQARREIGPATDVYSLGAILYEMLTGHPPFRGESSLETLQLVTTQEVLPPRRLQPKVPRDLETICLKCLRKEPARRYVSASELAEDLRRFAAGEPIRARPAGRVERFAAWCRRHPGVAILAALLVLVLSAGLAGVTWKWREAEARKRQAEQAEQRAVARAEAAADALKYLAASSVADTFGPLSSNSKTMIARVGQRPQVVKALQHACSLGEQLLADAPHPQLLLSLGEQYAELAVFQAALKQRADALRSCRRGLELLDGLDAAEREAVADPRGLALTYFLMGAVLMNLEQHGEAVPAFARAVEQQRRWLEQAPADRDRRKVLSRYYFHLAHVQREDGRLDESAATALERLRLWPADPDEVYDVACELARCAAKVGQGKPDGRLSAAERERRGHYAGQAIDVLRQAFAMGLKDAAAVRRDPDLEPLHSREDFRKLVAQMEEQERRR